MSLDQERIAACCEVISDSKVLCRDIEGKGKSRAVFDNHKREAFSRIRVDGCLLKNKLASDFVLSKKGYDLIVELKGCNVPHALKQISSTYEYLDKSGLRQNNGNLAALIVCTRFPRTDTSIQRLKSRFAKLTKGAPVHILSGDREHSYECLFHHKSPSK